jgi:hypothetical protein
VVMSAGGRICSTPAAELLSLRGKVTMNARHTPKLTAIGHRHGLPSRVAILVQRISVPPILSGPNAHLSALRQSAKVTPA